MKVIFLIILFVSIFMLLIDLKALVHMLRYAFKIKRSRMSRSEAFFLAMTIKYFRHKFMLVVLELIVISMSIYLIIK